MLYTIAGHVSCTYNLVGYWGTVKNEPDLYKVCEDSPYTKIIVGFIDFKSKFLQQFEFSLPHSVLFNVQRSVSF